VFLGAPSTGKSTMAERAAAAFRTTHVPEYGREYWEAHQVERRLTLGQLVELAEGHLEREDARIMDANRVLFIDPDATTTQMFSQYYHQASDPRLEALAAGARERYDVFFLCEDDIPYDATWDRSGDMQRREFQEAIRADLVARGIPFTSLRGSIEARLATVGEVLRTRGIQ
jgi:NadR type nicotinamide-nucleotide adenylyltransferase